MIWSDICAGLTTTRALSIPGSMRRHYAGVITFTVAGAWLIALTAGAVESLDPAVLTAGTFTTLDSGVDAFSRPGSQLDAEQLKQFVDGKAKFTQPWGVPPKASVVWGLGPLFNEDRCSECHKFNGRARAPADGQAAEHGMVIRLSIPGRSEEGGPNPHAAYGDQLQNRGIPGVPAEGQAIFTYEPRAMTFADGEIVLLRSPRVRFTQLQFGELGPQTMTSARIAPAMIGLGLLEAVSEETILEIARGQAQSDGGGKPNYVWDFERGQRALGRFGWKASQPSLRQQIAAALHGDIGATTSIFPDENCSPVQKQCREAPSASRCVRPGSCSAQDRPEALPGRLADITFYLQALAVPARRNIADPLAKQGEALFAQARCSTCHVPELKTGPKSSITSAAELVIHPYTDLLLHDMGDELADRRDDYEANGREWRTAPLWGIGLLPKVSGHSELLHDGRARNVTEAILWHGGQAERSREAFRAMSKDDREAIAKFVESL
jgi:CxxC motif-containing protein (DUF1111 family)